MTIEEQIEIFKRGADDILPSKEALAKKLSLGKPLKIKMGVDPTASDLHLGHTVPLNKLKQLQEIGHHIQFLIGDFTAQIGDPSGRSKARPPLSREEVLQFARSYTDQVFKILDREKTEVVYNGDWLEELTLKDAIRLLSKTTVARILERNDFENRLKNDQPIHLHEIFYPLLQGYDSVALESDVEIGGTDQHFNLLMGRQLQQAYGQEPQILLTLPLLRGTDGRQKMSKSYGNHIGINEDPRTMFDKILSVPDQLTLEYFTLLSDISGAELKEIENGLADYDRNKSDDHRFHPRKLKERLAREIVTFYHGDYHQIGSVTISCLADNRIGVVTLLSETGICSSKSEARRLIKQKGIKINGRLAEDTVITLNEGDVISKGKKIKKRVIITPQHT